MHRPKALGIPGKVLVVFELLLLFMSPFCCGADQPERAPYVPAVPGVFDPLPDATGIRFFGTNLYVSSTLGLISWRIISSPEVLRWDKDDPVADGLWVDNANDLLWTWLDARSCFAHFDGKKWSLVPMAKSKNPLSRRDLLQGFNLTSNNRQLKIYGAGSTWAWDPVRQHWSPIEPPQGSSGFLLFDHLCDELEYLVFSQTKTSGFDSAGNGTAGQAVYAFEHGLLRPVAFSDELSKLRSAVTLGTDSCVILNSRGDLYYVHPKGIRKLKCDKPSKAIAVTGAGGLMSFDGENIGVFDDEMNIKILTKPPISIPDSDIEMFMAENNGQIALTWNIYAGNAGKEKIVPIWLFRRGSWQNLNDLVTSKK